MRLKIDEEVYRLHIQLTMILTKVVDERIIHLSRVLEKETMSMGLKCNVLAQGHIVAAMNDIATLVRLTDNVLGYQTSMNTATHVLWERSNTFC